MHQVYVRKPSLLVFLLLLSFSSLFAQGKFNLKFKNSAVFAGIEVGSKGVKMSVLEIGKNAQKTGAVNPLKDSSVNTDFITFSASTFQQTLDALHYLFEIALNQYNIPAEHIFTAVSSGVKMQADKEAKADWITTLSDSFSVRANDPARRLSVIDIKEEARLSHLGIVPDARRYTTFLIDIGSGNSKGGYFPNGNTKDLKLFQLNWGTKSTTNATEKRCEEDKSLANFNKQLYRVLAGAANTEVVYAVNESGAYAMSDYIAFSGGISWSVATLLYPELIDNAVVPVTYPEVERLYEMLFSRYNSLSPDALVKSIADKSLDKVMIGKEVKRVHQVFDQRSLLAGTGLLLKIMRQFEGIYEKKQFYLVKNGQVGWISAYVDEQVK
ncbi:MAG: hypothetical protein Q7T76_13840 [Ferruginibacter sp.]|nr:hypothetical protein [Ferruginibacter sp.]